MTPAERERALTAEINALGDVFDQYGWLVAKSAQLAPLPDSLRRDENLVAGCQSRVWVALMPRPDGTLTLAADSDTLILRGVLALFAELAEGRTAAEISGAPWSFLSGTELTPVLTEQRGAGLSAITEKIREKARSLL